MKQVKERVIAIDYFRGICILIVVLNHSWMFSMPFAYLAGAGGMWTSAAGLFFLLSGITTMIVRGRTIKSDFRKTVLKIWRRAGVIYLLYALSVSLSLCLIYLLPEKISSISIGPQPASHGLTLLWQILSFQYSIGLASFLMYYSVFLILTPLVLYLMLTRIWVLLIVPSAVFYVLASLGKLPGTALPWFAIWQLYFVLGFAIARVRLPALRWFYSLNRSTINKVSRLLAGLTATSIIISALLAFNLYPTVDKLVSDGWLPSKIRGAYFHLLQNSSFINNLFGDDRMGLLRPLAALLFLFTGYLLYQRHKEFILKWTGKFVITMGKDTLWIFIAQALAIPILAALPLRRSLTMNFILTSFLVLSMWLVTKRRMLQLYVKAYSAELQASYMEAKNAYLYRSENDI